MNNDTEYTLAAYDYALPPELIAQEPAPERDKSRLLMLGRGSGQIQHRRFDDFLELLNPGDVLVVNDTRVFPARLRASRPGKQEEIEVLLLKEVRVHL